MINEKIRRFTDLRVAVIINAPINTDRRYEIPF